jgi:protein-S-isoprenylcysteine O-methyltransferase Ste14
LESTTVSESADTSNAIIRPPIAWAIAILAAIGVDWLYPLRFVPASVPRIWVGSGVFAVALALAIWAIVTITKAGSRVETNKPTTMIVTKGPFRFTRNPIYLGFLLGQAGLAIGFDNLWMLATLVPLYLVLRYGVIAREESYLEHKFPLDYLSYKSRVRRWL